MAEHVHKVTAYLQGTEQPTLESMNCIPTWQETCISYACTSSEWVLVKAHKGDRIMWKKKGQDKWTVGTFMWSMLYDGIIGKAYIDDPDDLITVALMGDVDMIERAR